MLTSELSIVEYRSGRAFPDRLTRAAHRHYLDYARRMRQVYARGTGRRRCDLHREVEQIFREEPNCPVRRIAAFCKLLDDQSTWQTDSNGRAAKMRLEVFSRAAAAHPLVSRADRIFERTENETREQIAAEMKMPWSEIEQALYADVLDYQPLLTFEGDPDDAAFLARYNVAQIQAALYRAQTMTIRAGGDFKTILRYAKLARLMHDIRRLGPSLYAINLSGPASILHETRRYGIHFARFLPALLACGEWTMSAVLKTPWNLTARLDLSDRDGFTSHLPSPDKFDSSVEETFAAKFGAERDGWTLIREGEILHDKQTAFVPDFVFRHCDGTEVLMEIVGFWTPEYLAHRRETLRRFQDRRILLAVPEKTLKREASVTEGLIGYKKGILIKSVMEALDKFRTQSDSPASL